MDNASGRALREAALSPSATEPVPVSSHSGDDQPRDERAIDLAIMAFIGAKLAGDDNATAGKNAKAILELFGFDTRDSNASLAEDAQRLSPEGVAARARSASPKTSPESLPNPLDLETRG